MTARAVNAVGYNSPLAQLARLPGESEQFQVGGAIRREVVTVDPLAAIQSKIDEERSDSTFYDFSPQPDPFDLAVKQFLSQCRTMPANTSSSYQGIQGLLELAAGGAWTKVVEICTSNPEYQLYKSSSEDLTLHWQLRLEGMFRLKMFDEIGQDTNTILNEEDGALGSSDSHNNISLAMRLLSCEIKIMTGRCDEAVEQLLLLRKSLVEKEFPGRIPWDLRFQCAIVNAYIRMRQWRLAVLELRNALADIDLKFEVASHALNAKLSVLCLLARVLLQVGAIEASAHCCEQAWTLFSTHVGHAIPQETDEIACFVWTQIYTTRGLTFFGSDQFEDASKTFQIVLECQRNWTQRKSYRPLAVDFFSNPAPADSRTLTVSHPFVFSDSQNSSLAIAVNNYCICQLYLKQVKIAISTLEQLIQENPTDHMVDPVVFNLCTLYDLSCSPDVSTVKKKVLQQVAAHFHIDEQRLYWQSFRLN